MGLPLCTGDDDIVAFGKQEFKGLFRRRVSPLAKLNGWVEGGLVQWDDTLNSYLEDWNKNSEARQPKRQKQRFRQLTGRKYRGS